MPQMSLFDDGHAPIAFLHQRPAILERRLRRDGITGVDMQADAMVVEAFLLSAIARQTMSRSVITPMSSAFARCE
jgi:hypothetical protein